jgi:hypothetical protein
MIHYHRANKHYHFCLFYERGYVIIGIDKYYYCGQELDARGYVNIDINKILSSSCSLRGSVNVDINKILPVNIIFFVWCDMDL